MDAKQWDRIAGCYHAEIVSPFTKGIVNPIFEHLDRIKSSEKIVADLGTGTGPLLGFLSERFKEVHAIDFSQKMIKAAKQNNRQNNIIFTVTDLRDLSDYKNKFDVCCACNSVILPSIVDVKKIFSEIYASIKPSGVFLGIFPSMESVLYNGTLVLHREIDNCDDEQKAIRKAERISDIKDYKFLQGIYKNRPGELQKFYYKFGLKYILKKEGFKDVSIEKVLYPWRDDVSDFENFPKEEPMWDWFVSCRK